MAKRIIWSANALADRIDILNYWYERIGNKVYSKKLDKQLQDIIQQLLLFPELGRKMENREERYLIKKDYQIYYSIHGEDIHLYHIWDCRRNPNELIL